MQVKNTNTDRVIEMSKARYEEWYADRDHIQPMDAEGNTPDAPAENLEDLKVVDLRKMASEMNVDYVGLVKADLIEALQEAMEDNQ